jgi:hypothetical protein
MALIPLKDSIIVITGGALDEWGVSAVGVSTTYKCRIDEGTRLTRNQNGDEVVTTTQVLINGGVAVDYDDEFTWTDSSGVQRTRKPIRISAIKDFSSRVLFTEVEL